MTVTISAPQFEPGSFRDPDTKVFHHDGALFRCLTERALADRDAAGGDRLLCPASPPTAG